VGDGSIKQLNPEYRGTKADGTQLSGLGNIIANVECCPSEPRCTDDFIYEEEEDECFSDLDCLNSGGPVPISDKSYVTFSCQNGICMQSEPIEVECTTNAQCSGGEICDLSTTNYGNCIEQELEEYCGDGICQADENAQICPSDCYDGELQCNTFFQTKVTTTRCGIKCLIGFEEPQVRERCALQAWVWIVIILIFLSFIIGITILIRRIIR